MPRLAVRRTRSSKRSYAKFKRSFPRRRKNRRFKSSRVTKIRSSRPVRIRGISKRISTKPEQKSTDFTANDALIAKYSTTGAPNIIFTTTTSSIYPASRGLLGAQYVGSQIQAQYIEIRFAITGNPVTNTRSDGLSTSQDMYRIMIVQRNNNNSTDILIQNTSLLTQDIYDADFFGIINPKIWRIHYDKTFNAQTQMFLQNTAQTTTYFPHVGQSSPNRIFRFIIPYKQMIMFDEQSLTFVPQNPLYVLVATKESSVNWMISNFVGKFYYRDP